MQAFDLNTFTWSDPEPVGCPTGHISTLALYRESVVRPSLKALSDRIDELNKTDDVLADFELMDYEPMYGSTIEGFLLVVQSMWERTFREMLLGRAKQLQKGESYKNKLQHAKWPDLKDRLAELLSVPLSALDSAGDLDLLQLFGNAFRHGDGAAARTLFEQCPELWAHRLEPGSVLRVGSFEISIPATHRPSIKDITISAAVLEQMILSVTWFWDDMEYIRCNSFKRKHPSVVVTLQQQQTERSLRQQRRVWTPGRPAVWAGQ